MNSLEIIKKYYTENSDLYKILIDHSSDVTQKAIIIADTHPELNIDKEFISDAGMIHDIGIYKTYAPDIKCYGDHPYIAHGYLGREIIEKEGYIKQALVCERHTGVGLSLEEIKQRKLPIPFRDMTPISIEEQVICFADCFFSKTHLGKEKSVDKVRSKISKFGDQSVEQFDKWCKLFLE